MKPREPLAAASRLNSSSSKEEELREVAGVIGRRKFAYDLWGDTVNLASRLESHGEPGRILVAEATAARLAERYAFGPPQLIELKGKGPTAARFLLGRMGRESLRQQR